jgi:small subunit ribosomal protein S1
MLGREEVSKLGVGHEVNVYVLKPEDAQGNMIVSINIARRQQDWVRTEEMQESGELFEGEVIDFNKGGLLVPYGNLRGFIPASQLSDLPRGLSQTAKMDRLKEYVGQNLPLKVIEVDRRRRRLILSERAARRRWREQQKEQLLESLMEGQVRSGIVSGLADFGAFVDLGGADGLIHVSELSWDRVSHPREVLEPGQEVEVYVLRLDHERKRIGLSLKRLQPDPWSAVEGNYEIDQVVKGTITNVVDFGAFACVEPGIEGLIHVSEIADGEVRHPSDVLEVEAEVWVRVISIDSQRKRMGLSLREVPAMEEPEPQEVHEDMAPEGAEEPEADGVPGAGEPNSVQPEADETPVSEEADSDTEVVEVSIADGHANPAPESDQVEVAEADEAPPAASEDAEPEEEPSN